MIRIKNHNSVDHLKTPENFRVTSRGLVPCPTTAAEVLLLRMIVVAIYDCVAMLGTPLGLSTAVGLVVFGLLVPVATSSWMLLLVVLAVATLPLAMSAVALFQAMLAVGMWTDRTIGSAEVQPVTSSGKDVLVLFGSGGRRPNASIPLITWLIAQLLHRAGMVPLDRTAKDAINVILQIDVFHHGVLLGFAKQNSVDLDGRRRVGSLFGHFFLERLAQRSSSKKPSDSGKCAQHTSRFYRTTSVQINWNIVEKCSKYIGTCVFPCRMRNTEYPSPTTFSL
jgi:hypothetical protein